jgi:hypothetical protein
MPVLLKGRALYEQARTISSMTEKRNIALSEYFNFDTHFAKTNKYFEQIIPRPNCHNRGSSRKKEVSGLILLSKINITSENKFKAMKILKFFKNSQNRRGNTK